VAGLTSISRGAVILEPTDEYIRWARNAPGPASDAVLATLRSEARVYLMPPCESANEANAWLRSNYLPMFREELRCWCTNEASWPEDSSYGSFRRFFNVRIASMVFDLAKGSIRREA
jgi:hypothetical protein